MGISILYLPEEETPLGRGVFAPTITCDACGQPIEDMQLGAYVLDNRPEACPQPARFAHKGQCHRQIDAEIKASGGHPGWDELRKLPARLANNMNADEDGHYYVLEKIPSS